MELYDWTISTIDLYNIYIYMDYTWLYHIRSYYKWHIWDIYGGDLYKYIYIYLFIYLFIYLSMYIYIYKEK